MAFFTKNDSSSIRRIALYGACLAAGYATLHGGGFSDIVRWVIAFVGAGLMLLLLSDRNRRFAVPPWHLIVAWSGFLLWATICSIFSADSDASLGEVLSYYGIITCAFLVYSLSSDETEIRKLLFVLLLGAAATTAVGWYFFLVGKISIEGGHDMIRHFIGPFFWKNPMAAYLILFLPIASAMAVHERGWKRAFAIVLSILMLGGLVLTRSRAGWIAFAISIAILFIPGLLIRIKAKSFIVLGVIAILGTGIGFALAPRDAIAERAESIVQIGSDAKNSNESRSTGERVAMLEGGIEMIGDYPVFGVGPRAWPAVRAAYLKKLVFLPRFPHNAYLRIAAETGIPGLLLLCIALLSVFIPLWKSAFDKQKSLLSCAIATGLTGLFMHMAVDFDAAFAGILLPSAIVAALGLRLTNMQAAKPRRLGRSRISIIIILSILILILLSRAISDQAFSIATMNAKNGDLERAEKQANVAAKSNPLSWKSRHLLSNIHISKDEHAKAFEDIESALRLAPTIPDLHSSHAHAALVVGDTATAIHAYRTAIELAPRATPESYLELADIYWKMGEADNAEGILIAAIDAMLPFSGNHYTAPTSGFRYRSSVAWGLLEGIWSARGDSTMAAIAEHNAEMLRIPRKNDLPARILGLDTPSPEITVVRLFEAIANDDTANVRALTTVKTGDMPHFAQGLSMNVAKILDVREKPLEGVAEVDVLLRSVMESGEERFAKSKIHLLISDGRWTVSFEGG